eukprot:208890_1
MAEPSLPALPRTAEQYAGKTTTIEHEKEVRNQNDKIKQIFAFEIKVVDGMMRLFIRKDSQRQKQAKQQSQINALTGEVLCGLLRFMGFEVGRFKKMIGRFRKMKKPQLVEFICAIFFIPTTASLNIGDADTNAIIDNQMCFLEEDPVIYDLVDYIDSRQSNMIVIGNIIEECQRTSIDLFGYVSEIWIGMFDNFEVNKDVDSDYKNQWLKLTSSDAIIASRRRIQGINLVVNKIKSSMTIKSFWYAFDLLVFRFFNHSIVQYILSTYAPSQQSGSKQTPPISETSEQRKCAIYKYFGAALRSLQKTYKGKNYGALRSVDLLTIVGKCLLTYDTSDVEDCKTNDNDECKDYFKVPLRIRLQNRGYLRIINEQFYKHIAHPMYSVIADDVKDVFVRYDPKQFTAIESKIVDDDKLFTAFDTHIGRIATADSDIQLNKIKVYKELIHKVTSRIVTSIIKRNKKYHGHCG